MRETLTFCYLWPAIHYGYDKEFSETMSTVIKAKELVNMFIGDVSQPDIPYSVFILFDKSKSSKFGGIINYFEGHESYVYDYEVDDSLHMVVLQIPHNHFIAYEMFKESKYSKMYSVEFINKHKTAFANYIIIKDNKGKITDKKSRLDVFVKTPERAQYLKDKYGVDELAEEYDSTLNLEREIFNLDIYNNY